MVIYGGLYLWKLLYRGMEDVGLPMIRDSFLGLTRQSSICRYMELP